MLGVIKSILEKNGAIEGRGSAYEDLIFFGTYDKMISVFRMKSDTPTHTKYSQHICSIWLVGDQLKISYANTKLDPSRSFRFGNLLITDVSYTLTDSKSFTENSLQEIEDLLSKVIDYWRFCSQSELISAKKFGETNSLATTHFTNSVYR